MTRVGILAAMVGPLAALALGPIATAHDHNVPRTVLSIGDQTQRGRLGSHCWTRGDIVGSVEWCADGPYSWPKPKPVTGRETIVTIHTINPPLEWHVSYWSAVRRGGYPKGRARVLEGTLESATAGGEPAWAIRFELPPKKGHHYIDFFGVWTDIDGSLGQQDASWTFHILRR